MCVFFCFFLRNTTGALSNRWPPTWAYYGPSTGCYVLLLSMGLIILNLLHLATPLFKLSECPTLCANIDLWPVTEQCHATLIFFFKRKKSNLESKRKYYR